MQSLLLWLRPHLTTPRPRPARPAKPPPPPGRPKAFQFPFPIDGDKVNNFTVKLTLNKDSRWTKALKFMLANLKVGQSHTLSGVCCRTCTPHAEAGLLHAVQMQDGQGVPRKVVGWGGRVGRLCRVQLAYHVVHEQQDLA